jgi:hypothetical protein
MQSSSSSEEGEAASTEDTSYYTPPVEGEEYVSPPEPVQQTDPNAERQKQIRELEDKKDELEGQAKEARETVGAGGLWHSRNTGDQYRKAREAEAQLQKVDKQINESRSKSNQRPQTPVNEQPVNEQPQPAEEYAPPEEAPADQTPADTAPADEQPASEDTNTEEPPS